MEVPEEMKRNLRAVLLSKDRGVALEDLCRDYENFVNQPLCIKELGYQNLEAFLRAIPDAARLI
jgi:hypothetical protein